MNREEFYRIVELSKDYSTYDEFRAAMDYFSGEQGIESFLAKRITRRLSLFSELLENDAAVLKEVWRVGRLRIKDIVERTTLSYPNFAAQFGLPYRTIKNWESDDRTPPSYILLWLAELSGMVNIELSPNFPALKAKQLMDEIPEITDPADSTTIVKTRYVISHYAFVSDVGVKPALSDDENARALYRDDFKNDVVKGELMGVAVNRLRFPPKEIAVFDNLEDAQAKLSFCENGYKVDRENGYVTYDEYRLFRKDFFPNGGWRETTLSYKYSIAT